MPHSIFKCFLPNQQKIFEAAIRESDFDVLHALLEKNQAHHKININKLMDQEKAPLYYLLEKHDFTNAYLLLKAGAKQTVILREYIIDIPLSGYDTQVNTVQNFFRHDEKVTHFLKEYDKGIYALPESLNKKMHCN